jgi:rhodanese-related sulfurtransferase
MTQFRPAPAPGRITPAEAHDRARTGEAVLLDVREEMEFAAGHAPDAVFLPLSRLMAGATVPADGAGRPVMAICRSGNRSQRAAEILGERGFTTLNVVGGMQAWEQAGLPVSTGQGGDGQTA